MGYLQAAATCVIASVAIGLVCGRLSSSTARLALASALGLIVGSSIYAFAVIEVVRTAFPDRGASVAELRVAMPGFAMAVAIAAALPIVGRMALKRSSWVQKHAVLQAAIVASMTAMLAIVCRPWEIPIY